jgi:hypothetical protein
MRDLDQNFARARRCDVDLDDLEGKAWAKGDCCT